MCEPHFQAEDEDLFVEVVAHDERLRVHAEDMAREHDQLRQLTARMAEELGKPFTQETMFHCERLLRVLRGHAQKEELLLFSKAGVSA
jgi:hemerythrin-like domain-containing protein